MKRSCLLLMFISLFSIAVSAQKSPAKKGDPSSGSFMEITVVDGTQRTDIKSTQYATHDGYILKNPDGKYMLFFGAGSSGDGPSFTFTGQLDRGVTGTHAIGGEGTSNGFNLMATVIKGTTMLMPNENGEIVINAFPIVGGYVTGTFHAVCQTVTESGDVKNLDISGSFKLSRR